MTRPRWTVAISCHHEEQSLDEFLGRLLTTIDSAGLDAEVVAANDGSTDGTFALLEAWYHRDPRIHAVVDLFRNAGQAAGLTAALAEATGEHYVLIDSDLQLDPEELPAVLAKFDEGYDVVCGYRAHRADPWARRVASRLANVVTRRASGTTLRDFGCTYRAYHGEFVRAFALGPHKLLNQVELLAAAGRVAEVPVAHHPRKYGRSGWTVSRLVDLNTDYLLDLTRRPFQYLAACAALGATALTLRVVLDPWIREVFLTEVTNGLLLNAITISLLVTIAVLAFTGELILRSFTSLRRRPAYVVRRALRRAPPGGTP